MVESVGADTQSNGGELVEQLFSWGWDGLILVVVALLALRAIPVAFDAWKTGNLVVGAVKTVGPIVTLAALLYGGYMVINNAAGYILADAKSSPALQEARNWTAAGAGAIESGAGDLGSGLSGYVESFRSEWSASAAADAGVSAGGADSAAAASSDTTVESSEQAAAPASSDAPAANAAAEWLRGAAATPAPTADAALWTAAGINSLWNNAGQVGPEPAVPTQGPRPAPTATPAPSFNVQLDSNGGGPTAADADNAIAAATARTYAVRPGDDLTKISVAVYGNKHGAAAICNANRSIIRDCNILRSGWVLTIPVLPNN